MKKKAIKKIQIIIDKLIDLQQDLCNDKNGRLERALDQMRELETHIENGYIKNGYLNI